MTWKFSAFVSILFWVGLLALGLSVPVVAVINLMANMIGAL